MCCIRITIYSALGHRATAHVQFLTEERAYEKLSKIEVAAK